MKKIILILITSLFLISTTSCSSSPESLAKQDAIEMNRAIEKGDADAMERANERSERHLNKFRDNSDDYFKYWDTYKRNLK